MWSAALSRCYVILLAVAHAGAYLSLQNYLTTDTWLVGRTEERLAVRDRHMNVLDSRLSQITSEKSQKVGALSLGSSAVKSMVVVRRIAEDWAALATTVGRYTELSSLGLGGVRWPTKRDEKAVAWSFYRIQNTYTEETTLTADRNLTHSPLYGSISALDCYNVALNYYKERHPKAAEWLLAALEKTSNGDTSVPQHEVVAHLAAVRCYSGDSQYFQSALASILKKVPTYESPGSLNNDYRLIASKGCDGMQMLVENELKVSEDDEIQEHKLLCKASEKLNDTLRCRYVHYQKPHLMFQPFKLEELQRDPPILRFYDVISDNEVEELRRKAKERMKPAMTLSNKGGPLVSDYRTSFVGWIGRKECPLCRTLERRIAEITRMNLRYAEDHQVSQYGVGGEYRAHHDYFGAKTTKYENDRLATLMFYLNEVKKGGNTIFLEWGLSVKPVKNSAVLWFHFFPNGTNDWGSIHSGCPVIEGEKWVMNKWIHNAGNEFKFPCGLHENSSYEIHYL